MANMRTQRMRGLYDSNMFKCIRATALGVKLKTKMFLNVFNSDLKITLNMYFIQ